MGKVCVRDGMERGRSKDGSVEGMLYQISRSYLLCQYAIVPDSGYTCMHGSFAV